MARRVRRKKPAPLMPGHSEETAAHRIFGRAFAKLGHERAPAYPGDKKDQNLGKESLDPLEAAERKKIKQEAIARAAEREKRRKDINEKKPKEKPPEDFYFSP
ncbi:MAG TPA: hypothetical protein QF533_03425 [Nitrospinota bacterium]|nr:hypothetical protein [Nitrospinota bacterium]MDP7664060.1 hypothetical protein [Nitrospinota bacterium]HJP13387.1 hypothetical protein [Nitrospinota bacterium]